MRRLLLFATLIVAPAARSQDTYGLTTMLAANGRFWGTWSDQAKAAYVIGVGDGMGQVFFYVTKDCSCAGDIVIKAEAAVAGGRRSSYMDLVHGIDDFFKDPTNRVVRVIGALQYVTAKIQGASRTELEDLAAKLRREADQTLR